MLDSILRHAIKFLRFAASKSLHTFVEWSVIFWSYLILELHMPDFRSSKTRQRYNQRLRKHWRSFSEERSSLRVLHARTQAYMHIRTIFILTMPAKSIHLQFII